MDGRTASPTAAKVAGAQIRALRMRAGLTLDALGKRIGLTRQGVQRIETGAVASDINRYQEIAGALGVPLRTLFARPPARRAGRRTAARDVSTRSA